MVISGSVISGLEPLSTANSLSSPSERLSRRLVTIKLHANLVINVVFIKVRSFIKVRRTLITTHIKTFILSTLALSSENVLHRNTT